MRTDAGNFYLAPSATATVTVTVTATKPTPRTVALALVCLVALLCGRPGLAAELYGRVVGVSDGETITVLDAEQVTYKIRLFGIDAPEKAQPFGERAKQQLSDWVYHATVRVMNDKTDRYGRIVGKVTLNGDDVTIQTIHAGLAWHYKAYEHEQPALDRVAYSLAEINARGKAIGLCGMQTLFRPGSGAQPEENQGNNPSNR